MSSSGRASLYRLLRGSFAYGLLPLVGLLTAPLLARILGPTGRGQLAAVLQPLTVIEALVVAGVPTAVTYFIGRGMKFRDIRQQVSVTATCTVFIAFLVIIVYSEHISRSTGLSHLFVLTIWCSCLATLCLSIRRAIVQGRGLLGVIDVERILIAMIRLLSVVALFWLGVTAVEPYIIITILPGIVAATILFLPRSRASSALNTQSPPQVKAGQTFFYSYAFFAGSGHIANIMNVRIDQALLPLILSSSQLGLFAVAVTIAELPTILSTVTTRNLLTEASRGTSGSALLKTAFMGTALVAITGAILWALCPWATVLLFGSEFSMAAEIAQVLLIGTIFSSITAASSAVLTGTGQPGKAVLAPLAGIATFILGFTILADQLTTETAALLVLSARVVSCIGGSIVLYVSMRHVNAA